MSSSDGQGGLGRAPREVALPVVACPPQQRQPRFLSSPEHGRHNGPVAFCGIGLCIVFWLGVCVAGIAVLGVYVVYHPRSPHLHISDATLNAGNIDELTVHGDPGTGGLALNADLTVLALVYSNNTKIDIGLQYMQLDLTFKGHVIGTQLVLPAPVRKRHGDSVLQYVHFVASGVELPREDAEAWTNATVQGMPLVLKLSGRFHTKLYIGPVLRLTYWVYPHCTMWLNPPPRGALLKSLCYV